MRAYAKRPVLTAAAEAAVGRARGLAVPVAIVGRPASGAYAVARAIHRDGRPGGFVSVRTRLGGPAELVAKLRGELEGDPASDLLTVYVDDLEGQVREVQEAALGLVDEGLRSRGRPVPVRLVARLSADPALDSSLEIAPLALRLSVLRIVLPRLDERRDELAAIVAAIAEDVSLRLALTSSWLSPEAVRALAERRWPGDLEELETVLTRLLVGARGSVVTVEDVWDLDPVRPTAGAPSSPPPRSPEPAIASASPRVDPALEIVLTELAHELKNPMVTLKTFTQHLDRLLEDAEMRERFVGLAGEAIERMDGFLEEMLAFSRFREARPRVLPFEPLVADALVLPAGDGRSFSGTGVPAGAVIVADEEQIGFALRALARALSRRLPPAAPILYEWQPPGGLRFDSRAEAVGIALHNVVDSESRDELSASLDFFMARSLIERNRGTLVAERDAAGLHVRLQLPSAGAR